MAEKASPMAWAAAATTIFSLVAGVFGGWTYLSRQIERHRATERTLADAETQLRSEDYDAAWKTLTKASEADLSSSQIQRARENAAQRWLENIRLSGNQTFTSVAEMLEPVLTRGINSSKDPQYQADLLAHLGWLDFLRAREVPSSPDPERFYRDALQKDPSNPYALAMWGHWILWKHGNLADADKHFAAALSSPRANLHPYIRKLQLSAFSNEHSKEDDAESVRVANEIRKEHGGLDASWSRRILSIYSENILADANTVPSFPDAMSPVDRLQTFDWLIKNVSADEANLPIHAFAHAVLLESDGRSEEALKEYRSLHTRFSNSLSYALTKQIDQGILRLTHKN